VISFEYFEFIILFRVRQYFVTVTRYKFSMKEISKENYNLHSVWLRANWNI